MCDCVAVARMREISMKRKKKMKRVFQTGKTEVAVELATYSNEIRNLNAMLEFRRKREELKKIVFSR
jgi:hypothetical protein